MLSGMPGRLSANVENRSFEGPSSQILHATRKHLRVHAAEKLYIILQLYFVQYTRDLCLLGDTGLDRLADEKRLAVMRERHAVREVERTRVRFGRLCASAERRVVKDDPISYMFSFGILYMCLCFKRGNSWRNANRPLGPCSKAV